jgi:thioredoxin reductase
LFPRRSQERRIRPAGLTAAVYLARYRRSVAVYSEGKSRAAYVPRVIYPGFPNGISGFELIELLNKQAKSYGVAVVPKRINSLQRDADLFRATYHDGRLVARTVILTTGLIDAARKSSATSALSKKGSSAIARYAMRSKRPIGKSRSLAKRTPLRKLNSCVAIRRM